MLTEESIWDLLKYGEHLTLECKKAESNVPNSVWETYSAFANTVGGTILFGVEEHRKEKDPAKRFTIANIDNPQVRIKEFWDIINNKKQSEPQYSPGRGRRTCYYCRKNDYLHYSSAGRL